MTLRGRLAVLAVATAMLLVGDAQAGAQLDDDYRDATVSGRVVDGGDDYRMVVHEFDTSGSGQSFSYLFGEGLCVEGVPCDLERSVKARPALDNEGRYEATLPKAYLSGYETDSDWLVTASRAPRDGEAFGPVSSFEFEVNTANHAAPDLPIWDATPLAEMSDSLLRLEVDGAPEGRPGMRLLAEGESVWEFDDAAGELDFRLLEDTSVLMQAFVRNDPRIEHSDGNTIYHQFAAAPVVGLKGATVPLSRGASCAVSGQRNAAVDGCLVTDGDRGRNNFVDEGEFVTIDLGRKAELGVVVVRSAFRMSSDQPDGLQIQVSVDGTSWSGISTKPLPNEQGFFGAKGDPFNARFIRVGADEAASISEVSVFAPLADGTTGLRGLPKPLRVRGALFVAVATLGAALVLLLQRRTKRDAALLVTFIVAVGWSTLFAGLFLWGLSALFGTSGIGFGSEVQRAVGGAVALFSGLAFAGALGVVVWVRDERRDAASTRTSLLVYGALSTAASLGSLLSLVAATAAADNNSSIAGRYAIAGLLATALAMGYAAYLYFAAAEAGELS